MFIQGYSDFSVGSTGCHPGSAELRASFKLDTDVSGLFPYINAVSEKALYYDTPHRIQFSLDETICVLYPDKGAAVHFRDRDQARAFVDRLLDFLNDLHARKDTLVPDHGKFKPVPALPIFKLLPRSNCGACGFPTCMAFASALGIGETGLDLCTELTDQKARDSIAAMWETD